MRKFLLVLLSAVVLLAASCSSWMKDDDFYSDIENDVKVANAEQISVYVRYALTRQGSTDPDGPATFKVEIPHEISATTEPEYGFVRWAAFSTDFLATGDNQNKNKDVYFIDDADYNQRLLPHEITEPVVEFDDPKSPITKVTINEKRDDIFLVPIVAQRPAISLTIPAIGSSDVVRNMTVRINFTKPMNAASFKSEDGQYDKITITQGTISFSSEGDMEITSEDITDRFLDPEFSKNQKMITLKFKPEAMSQGFASNASVNITISKDVKDSYGFSMADDQKVSFTVGSAMDTLAPRITQLTAGTSATNFDSIKGMYKDSGTWALLGVNTKMESHAVGTAPNYTYPGSSSAPTDNINASFFDSFVANRLTGKLYIRVWAEDIAGSGSHADSTGIENDVQIIGIRARSLYNADGLAPASYAYTPMTAINYVKEANLTTSLSGTYESLIAGVNAHITETANQLSDSNGCLVEYDISSLPDGLIEIQVAAIDTITNNGFEESAGGQYSSTYGNGWASLFVVKDTTPPDPVVNSSYVVPDLSGATNDWFNNNSYSAIQITGDTAGNIVDYGHARLRSNHSQLKWVIKPTAETNWVSAGSPWQLVTSNYSGFEIPSIQGANTLTYALMDDLGNMSGAATACSIYYDSVIPVIKSPLYFVADSGQTAGIADTNVLSHQTLVIPVYEATSGVKSITLDVVKPDGNTHNTPFSGALTVQAGGTTIASTGYTISGKTITFASPVVLDGDITIKGITINGTTEAGNYSFNATIKDAADNPSTQIASQAATISIDNVDPVISRMYIPKLKKSITAHSNSVPSEDTTKDGWFIPGEYVRGPGAVYSSSSVKPLYIPLYLFITESDSGVHQIVFSSSDSVELDTAVNSRLVIKKIENYGTATQTITTIPTTDYVINDTKTITFNADKCVKSGSEFVLLLENIGFKEYTKADNTINVSVYDLSTRHVSETNISVSDTGTQTTTGVKSDAYRRSTNPTITMNDKGSDNATTYTSYIASSYTNDATVNLTVTVPDDDSAASANSGINSLRLSGAVFTNTTTVTYGNQTLPYELSANNTVITFKTSDAYITIHENTAQTLTISNVQLTDTTADGTKYVYLTAIELAGWETSSVYNSIVLDREAPTLVGAASGGVYTSGWTDSSVPYYQPGVNVYPHSNNYGKMVGSIPTFYTATTYNTGCYQYQGQVSASENTLNTSFTHGAVLGIRAQDNLALYGDTSSSTFIIYKSGECTKAQLLASSNGGTRITSVKMAGSGNTATDSTFHIGFSTGTYSAVLVDKAGNVSDVFKFRVVQDTAKPAADLQNRVLLKRPDASSNIYRNTEPATSNGSEITYKAYESNSTEQIKTLKYVTKASSSKYQIILNLGSAYASNTLVTKLDGTNPISTIEQYGEISATTSASPIEKYCISTWYGSWPTNTDTSTVDYTPVVPYGTEFPSGQMHDGSALAATARDYFGGDSDFSSYWRVEYNKNNWHTFGQSTSAYTESGNGIRSWVDANYNLIIEIPNDRSTPPISVFLRDGCGNMNYVVLGRVRASDMSTAPSFILDNKLGYASTSYGIVSTPIVIQNPRMTSGGTQVTWNSVTYNFNAQSANRDSGSTDSGVGATQGFIKDWAKYATYYNPTINSSTSIKVGLTLRYGATSGESTAPEPITYSASEAGMGTASAYTCRALLYCSKTRSTLPTSAADKNAFYTEIVNELAAEKSRIASAKKGLVTDWSYVKASDANTEVCILLDYPKPNYANITEWSTNLSNGEPDPYYIWYVFEDVVGNYEIGKLVNSAASGTQITTTTSGMFDRWLYDNEAPVITIRGTSTNPNTVTAANIASLIPENNGFVAYASGNNVYVHANTDFTSLRSGATLNNPTVAGISHVADSSSLINYTAYNPFADIQVSERTGVRAFAWSFPDPDHPTSTAYQTFGPDGSYGWQDTWLDSSTPYWYVGYRSAGLTLSKDIGESWDYDNGHGPENAYCYGNTNTAYSGKYSGVKIIPVLPKGKISTSASSATDLWLHVIDWTGNISHYSMGASGVKFINDSTAPDYSSSAVAGTTQPDQYYIEKNASGVNVRIAGNGSYANPSAQSDIKLYIPTSYFTETGSGIKGYSFAGTGISNATSDGNGPYLNLTYSKYHYNDTNPHSLTYYVYDNVGNYSEKTLNIVYDNEAPEISTVTLLSSNTGNFCDAENGLATNEQGHNFCSSYYDYPAKTHSGDSAPYHTYKANISDVPADVIQEVYIRNSSTEKVKFHVNLNAVTGDLRDIQINKWNSSSNSWQTLTSWLTNISAWRGAASSDRNFMMGSDNIYGYDTVTFDAAGTYYQIYAVDQSGNTSCQYFKLYLDNTAPGFATGAEPTVTITKGSINKDSSNVYYYTADASHKMTINFTLADAGIGSKFDGNKIKYYYRWGTSGDWTALTTAATTLEFDGTLNGGVDDRTLQNLYLKDELGNESSTAATIKYQTQTVSKLKYYAGYTGTGYTSYAVAGSWYENNFTDTTAFEVIASGIKIKNAECGKLKLTFTKPEGIIGYFEGTPSTEVGAYSNITTLSSEFIYTMPLAENQADVTKTYYAVDYVGTVTPINLIYTYTNPDQAKDIQFVLPANVPDAIKTSIASDSISLMPVVAADSKFYYKGNGYIAVRCSLPSSVSSYAAKPSSVELYKSGNNTAIKTYAASQIKAYPSDEETSTGSGRYWWYVVFQLTDTDIKDQKLRCIIKGAEGSASIRTKFDTADSTWTQDAEGPAISNYLQNGTSTIKGYNHTGTYVTVFDNQVGNGYVSVSYPSGAKFYLLQANVTDTSSLTSYKITKEANSTETVCVDWTAMVPVNVQLSGDAAAQAYYEFTLPDINTIHTDINIYFKDVFGNESVKYELANPDNYRHQWWLLNNLFDADSVSMTAPAWSDSATDFTFDIAAPAGSIIKNVTAKIGGQSVTPAAIEFNDYQDANKSPAFDGSKGYLNVSGIKVKFNQSDITKLLVAQNVEITVTGWKGEFGADGSHTLVTKVLTAENFVPARALAAGDIQFTPATWASGQASYEITPAFANGADASMITSVAAPTGATYTVTWGEGKFTVSNLPAQTTADQNVGVVINGASGFTLVLLTIPASAGGGGGGGGGASYRDNGAGLAGGLSGTGAGSGKSSGSGSKTGAASSAGFFRGIQNFFSKDNAEIKTAKKTKNASNTSTKIAEQITEQVTEKSDLPAIEAIDVQPVVTIPELTSEASAAVIEATETAAPAAKMSAETMPVETTAAAQEEKSSSKSAVIVVMLAILSCCGGAWFTLTRKKK